MSDEEIDSKIKAKLDALSGLISEEGAAHIIANENNVKLFDTENENLKIKDIYAGMRNIEVTGKVTNVFEVREFNSNGREGKVGSFIMGDETGMTRVTLWGSKADELKNIKQEDVVKVQSGFSKENNGRVEIHMNDNSKLVINPEGAKVEEVKRGASKSRKSIPELNVGDENVEILATIVQSYDPNFWDVCPNCNKKARQENGEYICNEHGNITPDQSYVMNCFLDDGKDNIRSVFFKNQVQNLTGKTHEEILAMKETGFEDLKNDLLGKIITVSGRVTQNEMFVRKEFIAQFVDANPDPKEEIKKVQEEQKVETKPVVSNETSNTDNITNESETSLKEEIKTETSVESVESVESEEEKEEVIIESSDEETEEPQPKSQESEDELMSLDDLESIDDDEDIYT